VAIDIMSAFTNQPPELDFVWPGFLAGTVGALVAPGAAGKSFFALQAAMAVACAGLGGERGDLLGLKPKYSGPVVYFAGEDPEPVLIHRIHAIGKYLDPAAREAVAENLIVEPVVGKRLNMMNELHLQRVIEYCSGARLIILDTLSRLHTLEENSNGDMSQLITNLEYIVAQTGGAAVLYLHHVNKNSAREKQIDQHHAARGASALVDNARWVGFIAKMTEDESNRLSDREDRKPIADRRGFFIRFGVSKQNYGAPFLDRWYERRDGGVLLPVDLVEAKCE